MLVSEVLERDVEGRCTLARIVDEVAKVGRDEFRLAYTHEDGSVSWHLVGRSRLQKSQAGSIRFRSLGEGSEATVALAIETTLPLPGFLQRQVVRGVDRGAAEGLRARCEGR